MARFQAAVLLILLGLPQSTAEGSGLRLGTVAAAGEESVSALLAMDEATIGEADGKNRPVSKVVNLLKDMIMQLEKEGEEDEEIYEKMACWCETNEKLKTKSVADAESRIEDLSSMIEETSAKMAQLTAEIGHLEAEVGKNQEALESATSLREKQTAEFVAEEKDMATSINSLKSAVVTLSKQHESAAGAAFLQERASVRQALMGSRMSPKQQHVAMSFLETGAYMAEPQSGEIFGVLKSMKENFEVNLGQSQSEEMENAKAYEDLKRAKEDELKAGQSLLETKQQELAAADEKNAQAKQDLEDTRATLDADNAFMRTLKEQCQNVDHDYEERTKTRQLEIQATSKALKFLSSDAAHDLFSRTFSLIQLRARRSQMRRTPTLLRTLAAAAEQYRDPRLSLLSLKSRSSAFEEVRKSIQVMVEKLEQEKMKDAKLKDYCVAEFHANKMAHDEQSHTKANLEVKISDLEMLLDTVTKEIGDLKVAISDLQDEMKSAGEDREKENKEFQKTVADQRATGKLLTAALDILKGFYDKAALVQTGVAAEQQLTSRTFKRYTTNAGGVMEMMQKIIEESKTLEEEAIRDEAERQEGYEKFVADNKESIKAMTTDVTSKSDEKARAESDKVEMEQELEDSEVELERLEASASDLHMECDFLMENWEQRTTARDSEIEALKQAISIFSGGSFSSLLEYQSQ